MKNEADRVEFQWTDLLHIFSSSNPHPLYVWKIYASNADMQKDVNTLK